MKKKIKVSFIGAGNMSKEHIKVFKNNQKFILKGILSRSKKKINEIISRNKKIKNYSSIKELYNRTKSDLVVIAVSEEQYSKIMKDVLKFPWVCLAEKPLGLSYKEIDKCYKLSLKRKRKIFISLNRRFYKSTLILKKIINRFKVKRKLKIIDCQSRDKFKKNAYKIGVKKSKKSIINLMYSNSVHLIDYLNFLCRGKLVKIKKNKVWNIKRPENFSVKMFFSSGDIAEYEAYWRTYKKWEVKIKSKKFTLKLKPLERILGVKKFLGEKKVNYKHDLLFKPGLYNQSKEIIKFFRGKKNSLVSISDYLVTARIIKIIYGR